jgi:hypothetical protein
VAEWENISGSQVMLSPLRTIGGCYERLISKIVVSRNMDSAFSENHSGFWQQVGKSSRTWQAEPKVIEIVISLAKH